MNRIPRSAGIFTACLLMILLSPSLFAQSGRQDIPGTVDFSVTLKTVSDAVKNGTPLPAGRLFILDGRVSDILVTKTEDGTFKSARITLLSGEWVGASPDDPVRMEDVKSYSCYVTFTGGQYADLFNARPSADTPPEVVIPSSQLIIVVRAGSIITTPDGGKMMSFEGVFFRIVG